MHRFVNLIDNDLDLMTKVCQSIHSATETRCRKLMIGVVESIEIMEINFKRDVHHQSFCIRCCQSSLGIRNRVWNLQAHDVWRASVSKECLIAELNLTSFICNTEDSAAPNNKRQSCVVLKEGACISDPISCLH